MQQKEVCKRLLPVMLREVEVMGQRCRDDAMSRGRRIDLKLKHDGDVALTHFGYRTQAVDLVLPTGDAQRTAFA